MEFGFNHPRDPEKLEYDFVVLSAGYYIQLPTLKLAFALSVMFFRRPDSGFNWRTVGDGTYDQIKGGMRIVPLNPKWSGVHYIAPETPCPAVLK